MSLTGKDLFNFRARLAKIKQLYGLAGEDFLAIFVEQSERCAVCKTIIDLKTVHVDHCHETKTVRGLLCHGCNVGLGHFKHDATRLQSAAHYIEAHKQLLERVFRRIKGTRK